MDSRWQDNFTHRPPPSPCGGRKAIYDRAKTLLWFNSHMRANGWIAEDWEIAALQEDIAQEQVDHYERGWK